MSKAKAIHLVGADGRVLCNVQEGMVEHSIPVTYYWHLIDAWPIFFADICKADVCKRCAKQVSK